MPSVLVSPAFPIEVVHDAGQSTLYIHQDVLEAIPFFAVQRARWTKDSGPSLRVELPSQTGLCDLATVLERVYFPSKLPLHLNRDESLRAVQVASMLDCSEPVVDSFALALRSTLRTDEDAATLCDFCDGRKMPTAIERLAKRPRRQAAEVGVPQLQRMLCNSAKAEDDVTLRAVAQHLRRSSRLGDIALREVAEVLGAATELAAMPLALEFVSAHPRFYGELVQKIFNCARLDDTELCSQFMMLGLKHVVEGRMGENELIEYVKLLCKGYCNGLFAPRLASPDMSVAFQSLLQQTNVATQLQICQAVFTMENKHLASLVKPEVVSKLSVEAKGVFVRRLVDDPADDALVARTVSVPILKAFGHQGMLELCDRMGTMESRYLRPLVDESLLSAIGREGMLKLCPAAHALEPAVKDILLSSTLLQGSGDSDEGF